MENPPLQSSMQQGVEHVAATHGRMLSIMQPLLLVLIFSAGGLGTFAYLTQAAVVPPVVPLPNPVVQVVAHAFPPVTLGAKSSIVIDLETDETLYERNADAQLPLASLTKVPLALAISEVLPRDTALTIPFDVPPTSTLGGLTKGSRWKSQDLIDLTLAASSNEGAEILAAAADEPLRVRYPDAPAGGAAVYRMNALAQALKLTHTYFLNTTGLDESTQQSGAYGSARDVAHLFAYAATTSRDLFDATTRPQFSAQSLDNVTVTARNTDHALDAIPGLLMGKTGLTDLAGGNLAVVFSPSPGHTVVAVVMGSTEEGRFDDMRTLVAAVVASYDKLAH